MFVPYYVLVSSSSRKQYYDFTSNFTTRSFSLHVMTGQTKLLFAICSAYNVVKMPYLLVKSAL